MNTRTDVIKMLHNASFSPPQEAKSHLNFSLSTALLFVLVVVASARGDHQGGAWKAAVSRRVVTPKETMYLAGFGDRVVPAEGTSLDLFVKCLALEDVASKRFILVTMDLLDVPRQLRDSVEKHIAVRHKLPREALMLNSSHTHCGPELRYTDDELAELEPARADRCRRYTKTLHDQVTQAIDEALERLSPARLAYGHARCGFAMNRRLKSTLTTGDPYLNRPNPDGVVDHDVPVLKVERPDGGLSAVVFGYACHNTTLKLKEYHGDYAGFAQAMIEKTHPGALALFATGCGGDQNGYPRMRLEYSETHGRSLAIAVEAALEAVMRPLSGPLRLRYGTTTLEFQPPPTAERLKARIETGAEYQPNYAEPERRWDTRRLREIERGSLIRSYSVPIQVIRFGDALTWIALPGETVVDYSLRLKNELAGSSAVWISGYSNDVFSYLPSKRLLAEGGYEPVRSMTSSSNPVFPAPFDPTVEDRIVGKVHELLKSP